MDTTHCEPVQSDLRSKLESALKRQYLRIDLYLSDKQVYCWRRYLSRLKGFHTISLDLLLSNIEIFSDYIVVADPSSALGKGVSPGQWLIVARKDFVIKCLYLGLPDIHSMKFKKPRSWSMWDQLGLELKLPGKLL